MEKRVRCCPSDCAVRSDWEQELSAEEEMLDSEKFKKSHHVLKLLNHPLRFKIILMLLNRDHCVCEFWYVFKEPQNLISYNLTVLKKGGLIESYYRGKHKIYRIAEERLPFLRSIGDIVWI
jgi:DNA-binding transcriptional ArsR family regulator